MEHYIILMLVKEVIIVNGQDTQSRARIGEEVLDSKGDKIGNIDEFYTVGGTEDFIWASVKTGFLGFGHRGFIPLNSAKDLGDALQVPYDKEKVKESPTLNEDDELTGSKEQELYSYYGIPSEKPTEQDKKKGQMSDNKGKDDTKAVEENTGDSNDNGGALRLHKYVVTDEVILKIPVQHEEIVIENDEQSGETIDNATLMEDPSDEEESGDKKKDKG